MKALIKCGVAKCNSRKQLDLDELGRNEVYYCKKHKKQLEMEFDKVWKGIEQNSESFDRFVQTYEEVLNSDDTTKEFLKELKKEKH